MRGPRRGPGVLLVAVVLVVVVLAGSASTTGWWPETHSRSVLGSYSPLLAKPNPPNATALGGSTESSTAAPISVSLSVNSPAAEVGGQVTFQLTISLVGCGSTFYLSSLGQLSIAFGDGFSYQEPGNTGGPGSALECVPPPSPNDTSDVEDFQYAYSNPGTYSVSAQVNWSSGAPLHTNNVTVDVSGSPIAFAVDGWFYGVIGVTGGALLLVAIIRQKMPKPPSLPPGAT